MNPPIGFVQYELERRAADERFKQATADDAEQAAFATLGAVAALLARCQDHAGGGRGFKQWLIEIAAVTKGAGKEGGNFLGWGAVPVNDEERAAVGLHEAGVGDHRVNQRTLEGLGAQGPG